jgi:Domain of unknown function (DUF4340)
MRKSTRNILLLAVVVVALGVGMHLELGREEKFQPAPLTSIDPVGAKSLDVRCAECPTRRFEHRTKGWWMLEPYPVRADDTAVARLASVAKAPVRKKLDVGAYDLAKLGLNPPRITMNIDDVRIEFGDEDPIEHDRYARVGSDVFRVPDRFGARLLESPETEIDRQVIDADAVVVEVSIDGQPPRADLAVAWKNLIAAQMQAAGNDNANSVSATIEFADGTKLQFSIHRENEHYVVRRSDIHLDYLVVESQAQALLGKAN